MGTRFPIYVVPDFEASAVVDRVTPRRLVTAEGGVAVREFAMTLSTPRGFVPLEIWTDERQRLARVVLPTLSVVVIRDNLASVTTRLEPVRNPGDEEVLIPSNGFSLAGTITKPAGAPARAPVVILVAKPGPEGRDHAASGIPVFGHLARAMSEAGYFAIRYDGRGTGQSGGRSESAGLSEYADDVIGTIAWVRRRKDVDADRVVLVGYGEGAPIAMLAARREKRVKGLVLLAAPGVTGGEAVLEQQQRLLSRLQLSDEDRAARIALQQKVNDATITGKGWEGVPADVRRQAESPGFRSWLQFDPAVALKDVRQPVLIVHGALDTEMPPAHADRLEQLSRTVRKQPPTSTLKVIVPGVNHLLVQASSGDVDEYASLEGQPISPAVIGALVMWLPEALADD